VKWPIYRLSDPCQFDILQFAPCLAATEGKADIAPSREGWDGLKACRGALCSGPIWRVVSTDSVNVF